MLMLNNPILATCIGMSAIVMWSTLVGLIRLISIELDALTCLMLLYSLSTIILCFVFKLPKFNQIPKIYYVLITLLFVSYELCFSFSVALAQNHIQTIEVGVINHLWPTFTIILMFFTRYLHFNYKLLIGIFLSALGVMMIQTHGFQLSIIGVLNNLLLNPISYFLAFAAAMLWAFYCVVLMKYKPENNIIVALFFCTSLYLIIKWGVNMPLSLKTIDLSTSILIVCAALCLSLGYAAWNIGMINGHANILVSSSYFVPILSAYFSSLLFGIQLDKFFWFGTSLVVLGALICWIVTALPSSWKYKIKNILDNSSINSRS
jgi:drug/metabolite transporter (DMT)-like permease